MMFGVFDLETEQGARRLKRTECRLNGERRFGNKNIIRIYTEIAIPNAADMSHFRKRVARCKFAGARFEPTG